MAVIGQHPQSLPGLRKKIKHVSAAYTVDVAQNGYIFMITDPGDAGYTIEVPSASDAGAGWDCRFVNAEFGAVPGTLATHSSDDVLINPASEDNNLFGVFINGGNNNAAGVDNGSGDPATTIGFDNTSVHGDFIEIWSDGTQWFVKGQTAVNGGILLAG